MPRKPSTPKTETHPTIVNFNMGDRTYQIDPERRKVYRHFVEIETSRAFEIFATWRTQNARV